MTDKPTCKSCKWWAQRSEEHDLAPCRRRAPLAGEKQLGINEPIWPTTKIDDFCGDYAARSFDPQEAIDAYIAGLRQNVHK